MKQKTKPKGKKDISIISDICMGECNDTWTSNIEDQLEDLNSIIKFVGTTKDQEREILKKIGEKLR